MGAHPWDARFLDVLSISAEGGFRIAAARDVRTARPCVVVSAAPGADPAAARLALERAHDAHSRIRHPVIAPAYELGPDTEYVAFDCPARLDLAALLATGRNGRQRVRQSGADGFICALRDALLTAAEHEDPRDGGPCCIGTLGYANVLFAPDGRFWLIGLGHNVALADEHGRIGGRSAAFQAPEVAVGRRATRTSDYVALMLFTRSLLAFTSFEPGLARVLAGNTLAEDVELAKKLLWFERRVVHALPEARASIEEALATSARIRELVGIRADVDAFRARVAEVLASDPRWQAGRPASALRIARDGSFVERPGGMRVPVPGRGALARILAALAVARVERPGSALSIDELFAAGWPGVRASARSARNRVHVALSTLRKTLARDLEAYGGSYRISPSVAVVLVAPESPPARHEPGEATDGA